MILLSEIVQAVELVTRLVGLTLTCLNLVAGVLRRLWKWRKQKQAARRNS